MTNANNTTEISFTSNFGFKTVMTVNPSGMFTSDITLGNLIWDIPNSYTGLINTSTTNLYKTQNHTIRVYNLANPSFYDECTFQINVSFTQLTFNLNSFSQVQGNKFTCKVGTTWSFGNFILI